MGRIERFQEAAWGALRVPAAEAALVDARLALAVSGGGEHRRLSLAVQDASFENPSDADLAGYGAAWFG